MKEVKPLKVYISVITLMILIYLGLVWLWDMTSTSERDPANFIDLEVKTPVSKEEWFKRRDHAD